MLGHQSIAVCEISDTYLLKVLEILRKDTMGLCCCLQACNSVLNMLIMGSYLPQVSCYMQKCLPFITHYGNELLFFTNNV